MAEMTAVERVETVLAGGIPDRVPLHQHDFLLAANESSVPFPQFMRDGEAIADGLLRQWRRFGHDVLIVESGTATLAEACGVGVEFLDDSAPVSMRPAIESSTISTSSSCPILRPRLHSLRTSRPPASWPKRSDRMASSWASATRARSRSPA